MRLQMPFEATATVATDVMVDGCTTDDVFDVVARIREATDGPLDLVVIAVPAGTGVTVEAVLHRAMGLEVLPAAEKQPSIEGEV